MPDTISSALGWALRCLRTAIGWTRARLARAAGLDDSLVRRYEEGEDLTRETANLFAGLLGRPPEALDVHVFAHRLTCPEAWDEPAAPPSPLSLTPEELRRIDRATLAAGWTAAEAVRAELVRRKKRSKAEAAQNDARLYWERLIAAPRDDRRDLVQDLPEFRAWPLALLACEASVRAAADSARGGPRPRQPRPPHRRTRLRARILAPPPRRLLLGPPRQRPPRRQRLRRRQQSL